MLVLVNLPLTYCEVSGYVPGLAAPSRAAKDMSLEVMLMLAALPGSRRIQFLAVNLNLPSPSVTVCSATVSAVKIWRGENRR